MGLSHWSQLFSVTRGGGVRVTLVKKNTSRARREEGSLPLVGVVPSHSAGISICHSGAQGH